MDNRQFNVNGSGDELLLATLKLAFAQSNKTASGWRFDQKFGLILCWYEGDGVSKFPIDQMSAEDVFPMVSRWLKSDEAATVEHTVSWDKDCKHDGHNSIGWRVYCGNWGHVGGRPDAICAIKPAYLWHGK